MTQKAYAALKNLKGVNRLMAEVLVRLISEVENSRRLVGSNLEWVSRKGGDNPLSYVNICNALGYDPEYVRERLREYTTSS
ncbi:hypothetical protein COU61_02710 [Candidatus Pacearchaeota archaeon CG10_big_fil_rev_8_21_14_0_10_35_13]|nr:MAG: hypothetical protein COU61_02710 [Candidatus Pacearchaeota archaeon CG10_big_fil_rev_8_21_14_0_10_35_13]